VLITHKYLLNVLVRYIHGEFSQFFFIPREFTIKVQTLLFFSNLLFFSSVILKEIYV